MSRRYRILAIGLIGAAALILGFRPFYLLFYAVLAGYVIAPLWARIQTSGIAAEIRPSATFPEAGQALTIEVSLVELGSKPHWGLRVTVDGSAAPTLPGHNHETTLDLPPRTVRRWPVILASRSRGMNQVGPISIQGSDPMGFHRHQRRLGAAKRFLVYPRIVPLTVTLPTGIREGRQGIQASHQAHGASSVARLRDYEPTDPMSQIHWLTSARLDKLMTAEREDDGAEDAVWVALNLDEYTQVGSGDESTTEYGVTIAASLAVAFLDASLPVGLLASGPTRVELPAERGERQRERILEALALARKGSRFPMGQMLSDYRQRTGPNAHLFLVTTTTAPEAVSAAGRWAEGPAITWILLDGQSFAVPSGPGSAEHLDQPVDGIVVRRGDDLAAALSRAIAQTFEARVGVQ